MEEVFDLREFIFTILHRWRLIVSLALIFCVLGGGYKAIGGLRSLRDGEAIAQQKKAYEDSLLAYQQQKDGLYREIENITQEMARMEEYNDKSLTMQINPYDEKISTISFYLDTGYQIMPGMDYQNPDKTGQILNLYLVMSQDGQLYEAMQKDLNLQTEVRYLREAISIRKEESNTITVTAIGNNEKQTSDIVNYIYSYFVKQKKIITEAVGEHTLQIVNQSNYTTVDLALVEKQKTNTDQIMKLSTAITEKNKALSELKEPASTITSKRSVIKGVIKFILLGGAGGMVIGVLLVFFIDVMDTTIRCEDEIKKRYKIRYLGSLPLKKGGKNLV